MSDMFLNDDELTELTHKLLNPARARVLNQLGIQHKVRADGSIAVLRAHVERVFGEKPKLEPETWRPAWMS